MKNFKKISLIVLGVSCIFILNFSSAMSASKAAVEIVHEGTDPIGSKLVYQIKEEILHSSGLMLTTAKEIRFIVRILTMDISKLQSGTASAVGITITYASDKPHEIFCNQYIGLCASGDVKEKSGAIVARIEEQAKRPWLGPEFRGLAPYSPVF